MISLVLVVLDFSSQAAADKQEPISEVASGVFVLLLVPACLAVGRYIQILAFVCNKILNAANAG